LKSDPQILLRSFVAGTDGSMLSELTDSLLQMAAEEQLIDFGLRQNYSILNILGSLISCVHIFDKRKGFLVRRMAHRYREACQVQEVVEDLVAVAFRQS
jgi:hypothetical protein